jgi:hypothetical protein
LRVACFEVRVSLWVVHCMFRVKKGLIVLFADRLNSQRVTHNAELTFKTGELISFRGFPTIERFLHSF